ncbi:MAG: sugar phosphate isomerase/epimerase [Planctomycetales bacterium]|nr:sugar phosphate isomerase/epimerase [Planctomycetales bacterium]
MPHSVITCAWLMVASTALAAEPATRTFAPPLFAFENGVAFGSFDNEAKTLKQLGYDGISQVHAGGSQLAERVAAYDRAGLRVLSVYLDVSDQPLAAELVAPLANRGALIELTIRKRTPATVDAVRQTAAMAARHKIRVALYPHHGFAVATMPQAMDLIREVDHPNLGVMLNLCHFLKGEPADDLESALEQAGSRLFAVSTCGASLGGRSWNELIQPLDSGNFPQQRLFRKLRELQFTGPVSLQCYAVPGDKRTNLERSMTAWREILEKL